MAKAAAAQFRYNAPVPKKRNGNPGIPHQRWRLRWALLVAFGAVQLTLAGAAPDFSKDVEALLRRYCLQCHGEAARMGDLDVRSPAKILKGGAEGPAMCTRPRRICGGESNDREIRSSSHGAKGAGRLDWW